MSSFFTLPPSQKKRKRIEKEDGIATKKRRENTVQPSKAKAQPRPPVRDESISGSDSEAAVPDPGLTADDGASDSSEHENETAAEKRLRLAERYLENLREEIDEGGFDAADLDRDLIAERLKEDVSETKGRVYRFIASRYDFAGAIATQFRTSAADCTTGIAVCPPYIYTSTKARTITKWELPPEPPENTLSTRPLPRRPKKITSSKGSHLESSNSHYKHHTSAILSIAASQDGKFVVTGGADKKLIVWSAEGLTPLRIFTQHRDSILGVAFRRGTNQLYSGSADRTIKTWSLNELAYVETLFGHQDHVADVAALSQERCLSAGSRDRTVRLWKVVDETQLVFRGGGSSTSKPRRGAHHDPTEIRPAAEGSIDRIAFIDDETFVSGSDNGSLSLWSLHKKKPIFALPAAHGFDPAPKLDESFADIDLQGKHIACQPEARWITALVAVPYSDLIITGSWDGYVRAWRLSSDKKKIESMGAFAVKEDSGNLVNGESITTQSELVSPPRTHARGVVNDLDVFERGVKGKEKLFVVAALGREHRLGRWRDIPDGKNGAVVFEVNMSKATNGVVDEIAGNE